MSMFVKKTYGFLVKKISKTERCIKCCRSEQDMMGVTTNTDKGIDIFSSEKLCIECEIHQFPDRFHGCGFCKRPIREKFSCIVCSSGFIEWIKDVIEPVDNLSIVLRYAAKQLLNRTTHDHISPIDRNQFILRTNDGYYKWPGFYAGVTNKFSIKSKIIHDDLVSECFPVWIVPRLVNDSNVKTSDLLKLDILNPDLKLFQKILLDILEKNNIRLYDDVQIDPDNILPIQIRAINPYDTRIVKL
jgi:hypothetical protein